MSFTFFTLGVAMPQHAVGAKEITEYWDGRARTYYNGVVGELGDDRRQMWEQSLDTLAFEHLAAVRQAGKTPRVLDLGCGPGFFCVVFASRGFTVDGVDASTAMLDRARQNIEGNSLGDLATLHCCDVCSLPFADNTFDLAISRNLTWLMRDPQAAYAEWMRVIAPGGKLLVFDANWYRYLVDDDINAKRIADQSENTLEGWDEDAQATSDEEKRCEEIARRLPMTELVRPAWDIKTLESLGATSVRADEGIWRELWTQTEQDYYASSPLFLIEASK